MAVAGVRAQRPASPEEAAALLRALGEERAAVRVRGGATKLSWGAAGEPVAVDLETGSMDAVLEHNAGDFTAVLQGGVPVRAAQEALAAEGQMLALDPPLGAGDAATIGGVIATNDSGPLRHRYGGVRDLVVGITIALSDGTLAKAGGKVIKNVAGYDLAKLFAGSYGTLGLIVSVAVRLHPRPEATATASGSAGDPEALARTAGALAALPLEADALDVAWARGAGQVLVRFGGAAAGTQAEATERRLRDAGLEHVSATSDDEAQWRAQRDGQRSEAGAVLKVSARPAELARVLRAAEDAGATVAARAGLGLAWVRLEGDDLAERAGAVRAALAPRACTLLDAPDDVRAAVDPWPLPDAGALEVMRRVKARFDPARIFRPGAYVGGI